jgi:hypothetical protein
MDFPKFDGTNPRLWKDKCELFFEVYGVSESLKHRFTALNFLGTAESWLETFERCGRVGSWEELHKAVCERFDRDQYSLHMIQLDSLHETASVDEYHAKFEQLTHNILLYNPNYDYTFFVVPFLNGLKDEIRAPIALHRPTTVDTTSALALLQEEELESPKHHYGKHEQKDLPKPSNRVFTARDKAKAPFKKDELKKPGKTIGDEKLAALMAYCKANGLCYMRGENWTGRNHKCPDQVLIHMLQKLLDLLQVDRSSDTDSGDG